MKNTTCLFRNFFFTILLAAPSLIFSQNASDALRYSIQNYGGTARSLGAGNALGALGADYSMLSVNPAGLAAYRTNELVFTPAVRFSSTDARLKNNFSSVNSSNETKGNFHFDNFGMVFHSTPSDFKWKTANFAIGMNQLANFSQATYFEGKSKGSLMDYFFDDYKNYGYDTASLDPFGNGLAYRANALYFQGTDTLTSDFLAAPNALVSRSQTIFESGHNNELVFSYAGNYDDKLSIGATVGVPFFSYKRQTSYAEADPSDSILYFDRLQFDEFLQTSGVGVNLKIGAIWRINQMFRIGAAFHTPTLVGFTDNFNNSFTYKYTDANGSNETTADATGEPLNYRLRTPLRVVGSAAVLFPKIGFLSADVEYLDYSASKFNLTKDINNAANRDYERVLNQSVADSYGSAVNIRVGGEVALSQIRLRGGYNLFGTPFATTSGKMFPNSAVSFGVGLRREWFYADFGYRFSKNRENFQPYQPVNGVGQTVETETNRQDFLLTVGFKF